VNGYAAAHGIAKAAAASLRQPSTTPGANK